ncbi:UbiA prenyltransferase [Dentipellis sp. KUC8613]|nr:UbiA prenyltransferase [Dentipellis sp. KUC8613]
MVFQRSALFTLPTFTELQAFSDLCRLSGYDLTGFWAVWTPTAWSIFMAYHIRPTISILAVLGCLARYIPLCLGIQSLMMTIDDILDHDIDLLVSRTRTRPIPRGAISLPRAWLFFSIQSVVGIYCARTFLSATSLYLSMMTWPILLVYPTLKRWTNLAPIPLGIMFNVGTCMGWSDISADTPISWATTLPLYTAACLWTICYETIYQHQDRSDDEKIGIYSMARLFGTWTIPLCAAAGTGFFAIIGYLGVQNNHGPLLFGSITLAGFLVLRRLSHTDINHPESCKAFFLGMPFISQLVLVGIAVDAVYHRISQSIPL